MTIPELVAGIVGCRSYDGRVFVGYLPEDRERVAVLLDPEENGFRLDGFESTDDVLDDVAHPAH